MNEPNERKDERRKKFLNKNNKKHDFADEYRLAHRYKKERKKKIENIRGEELWDDWKDWHERENN